MQTFVAGLSAKLAALDDPQMVSEHPKHLAELQAAILTQRQLSANFANEARYVAITGLHTHIVQQNLEQPWDTVLQVHKDVLVRRPPCLISHVKPGVSADSM